MRAAHHALRRVHRRAGGQPRDFIRVGRGVGVRIERHRLPGRFRNLRQVVIVVDAGELLACCERRRRHFHTAIPPACRDDIHRLGPLRALGMSGRRLVLDEPVRMNQDERHRRHDSIAVRHTSPLGGAEPLVKVPARQQRRAQADNAEDAVDLIEFGEIDDDNLRDRDGKERHREIPERRVPLPESRDDQSRCIDRPRHRQHHLAGKPAGEIRPRSRPVHIDFAGQHGHCEGARYEEQRSSARVYGGAAPGLVAIESSHRIRDEHGIEARDKAPVEHGGITRWRRLELDADEEHGRDGEHRRANGADPYLAPPDTQMHRRGARGERGGHQRRFRLEWRRAMRRAERDDLTGRDAQQQQVACDETDTRLGPAGVRRHPLVSSREQICQPGHEQAGQRPPVQQNHLAR